MRSGALFLLLALAPSQDDAVARMVASDAARWIDHADPIVRGEAAIVLAELRDSRHHDAILAVARDGKLPARLRGLLALGIQGTPGVVLVLDEILSNLRERTQPAGLCAAYALGALPPDHAPAVVARVLASFRDANWKRQGPVLAALLGGMSRHAEHGQAVALRQLHAVRANRDEALRAQILGLLLPADPTLTGEAIVALLENASDAERLTVLEWLEDDTRDFDGVLAAPIERLASTHRRADVRGRALSVLTRLGDPAAPALAARALRSRDPFEVEAGARSLLALGGPEARSRIESSLLTTRDPARAASLLYAWSAAPTPALTERWVALATDGRQPTELRSAAVIQLSRSDPERAAPLLRDVFRSASESRTLWDLSRAIVGQDAPSPQLRRLLPVPDDPLLAPRHWRALIAAGHPGATRRLLEILDEPSPPTPTLRAALVAWRTSHLPFADTEYAVLPEPLRSLLAGQAN